MPFDIETYVNDTLENPRRSGGDNYQASCPFCGKAAHFYINVETGAYICFKCEERGKSVAGIIAQVEGLTWERARALMMRRSVVFRRKETTQSLQERIRKLRHVAAKEEPEAEVAVDFDLPPDFVPVHKDGKWNTPVYLKERGITKATADAWGMGFCRRGHFGGRLIIPVLCPNGKSFTARDTTGEQQPRYLNPKGADHGRLLCGWNMADKTGDLVLVEGPLDAVKMWQHGIPALALMGKELHGEQFAMLLKRYPADTTVTVLLDPEEATAPYKAATRLLVRYTDVYVAKLPEGTDPGDSTPEEARKAMDEAVRFNGERGIALPGLLARTRKKIVEIYQR